MKFAKIMLGLVIAATLLAGGFMAGSFITQTRAANVPVQPFAQPTTFEELQSFLSSNQARPDTIGGLFEPDHPIVIQPTRTTRWDHAMHAFNAAARSRYINVTFAKPG